MTHVKYRGCKPLRPAPPQPARGHAAIPFGCRAFHHVEQLDGARATPATSCTRTIAAPCVEAPTVVASVASSRADGSSSPSDAPEERLARRADEQRHADARGDLGERAQQRDIVLGGLARTRCPDRRAARRRRHRRRRAASTRARSSSPTSRDDVVVVRLVLHRARRAAHVHRDEHGAARRRRRRSMSGSAVPPDTSLTIAAPASSAARGDAAFVGVDADRHAGVGGERRARPAGPGAALRRRRPASAPGRVDSPPTSSTAAPAAASCEAVRDRGVGDREKRPPSEKESGVTFTTPISARRGRSATGNGGHGGD